MRDYTHRRLRSLFRTSETTSRRFEPKVSLWLVSGILVCLVLPRLHAQQRPVPGFFTTSTPSAPMPTSPEKTDARSKSIQEVAVGLALLPVPPKKADNLGPLFADDLARVPKVEFEARSEAVLDQARREIVGQIAGINQLNQRKTDGFIEALRSARTDLTGLPFAMGDACRTTGERSKQFARAVATVRRALQSSPPSNVDRNKVQREEMIMRDRVIAMEEMARRKAVMAGALSATAAPFPPVAQAELPPPEHFWDQYQALCIPEDKEQKQADRARQDAIVLARIAALTQILLPMPQMHPGMAKYFSTVPHVEATRALARLAIFSANEDARKTAIEALKVRRDRDYTAVLVGGMRYPWPTVARRAAEAIVKLERNDLLSQFIDVLEQPDPRAPVTQEIKGKSVPVVRELVRVNHHRSCLLCHAPGNTGKVSGDAVRAEVPVPGQPLNTPSGGYNVSRQEILVRVDVTYLRQDFSVLQAVADANPWPEMQRFDFLVRTRELTDAEAATYREKLKPREPGEFSPYQRAALAALRELTGRDTEPTPEAWRRLLKLPAESQRKQKTS